ncbi:MAG: DUF1583 domain-containing protein, partial [Planctomycetaceae bacterium]
YDWVSSDGVIRGRRFIGADPATPFPSLLQYHRPLEAGDVVRYEFFHEGTTIHVDPAIGRLAFLFRPEGVEVHWMTLGGDRETAGIDPRNRLIESECRRASVEPLLKNADWNQVEIAILDGAVRLSLNGTVVYERALEHDLQPAFGLFHDKGESEARVRNVVLSGDWPEQLSSEQLANLFQSQEKAPTPAVLAVRSAVLGELPMAKNLDAVLGRARRLPPADRYLQLRAWVLPSVTHGAVRLNGQLTPTDPPPAAGTKLGPFRGHTGGTIEAPALLLVDTAREVGKLDELRTLAAAPKPGNLTENRAQVAFLALIELAAGQIDEAQKRLAELVTLLDRLDLSSGEEIRWAELVAAARGIENPATRSAARKILELMVAQQQKQGVAWDWERRLRHVYDRGEYLAIVGDDAPPFGTQPPQGQWSPVMHPVAESRGRGTPVPHWLIEKGQARRLCGHRDDYLYFASPLRGNFEVTCNLTSFGWREIQLGYAGVWFGIVYDLKRFELGTFG